MDQLRPCGRLYLANIPNGIEHGGIVDHDINPAKPRHGLIYGVLDGCLIGDVAHTGHGPIAQRCDLRLERLLRAGQTNDIGPCGMKGAERRGANSTAGACD